MEILVQAGDRPPVLFQSSPMLLDKPGSPYYMTEAEAKEKVDRYMIQRYYHPVQKPGFRFEAMQEKSKITQAVDASKDLSIDLAEDDF